MDDGTAMITVESARNAVNVVEIKDTWSLLQMRPISGESEGMPRAWYGTCIRAAGKIFRGDLNRYRRSHNR